MTDVDATIIVKAAAGLINRCFPSCWSFIFTAKSCYGIGRNTGTALFAPLLGGAAKT
jgi:hypothetical protein